MDAMLVDAQIIRLYQAFFNRQPDQTGFDYWSQAIRQQGASLADVAESFSQSTEFADSYGALNDDQFLELVYQNVLGRASDADGFAFWQTELSNGMRRGDMMVGFSESAEHIQRRSTETADSQVQLEKPTNSGTVFQTSESIMLPVDDQPAEASAMTAIDVNGDGLLDLLSAQTTPVLQDAKLSLKLFLNKGNGQFEAAELSGFLVGETPALQNTTTLLQADLNGDGVNDIVMAGRGVNTDGHAGEANQLLLSSGVNQWRNASTNLPDDLSLTYSLSAGDIDNDGDLDLLVGNVSYYATPYLLVNDGSGLFTQNNDLLPAQLLSPLIAREEIAVELADLNNDGAADMVIGADRTSSSYVVLSNGQGDFSSQPVIELPASGIDTQEETLDIEAVDLNGDGWLDLVLSHTRVAEVAAFDGNRLQILINQQGTGFVDETDTRLPTQSSSLLKIPNLFVSDLNGDGYQDLLAEQTGDYFLNNGQGVFSAPQRIGNYSEGDGPLVLADLDADQAPELIVTGIVFAELYQ